MDSKKKKKYVPICKQSVVLLQYLIPTFSTSAIVIDNQCSTGPIRGFFVTTIMTSPRIPILRIFYTVLENVSWIPIDTSSRSSHVT